MMQEDATTGRDAASEGRTLRWGATGQKRQWPWSAGGSRRPIAHIGTRGQMVHRRRRAKPCFNRIVREQMLEIRNGEDATTGRDAASEGRTLWWGATGQTRQWPWSAGGSRRLLAHTGTRRCSGAPPQTSKTSHDEDATTGRDAASEKYMIYIYIFMYI